MTPDSSVRRLMVHRMSVLAIPNGSGIEAGMEFFFDRDKRKLVLDEAWKWTLDAIATVRSAADPNPWKSSTDEEIATEILRRVGLK